MVPTRLRFHTNQEQSLACFHGFWRVSATCEMTFLSLTLALVRVVKQSSGNSGVGMSFAPYIARDFAGSARAPSRVCLLVVG